MKFLVSQLNYFFRNRTTKQNIRLLFKFFAVLFIMVLLYSAVFHFLMEAEGQRHSWVTGFYWTLTVMTTLGFGDITFTTDAGRIFSIVVLVSGVIFLLILLPFTFIQFFYAPWIEAQSKSRAPRELPVSTRNHVIITTLDPVTISLIEKLEYYKRDYVLLVEELPRALELYDSGYRVAVGMLDDPETYKRMRVHEAALVVSLGSDEQNTNIAFTVRELTDKVSIVTSAISFDSVDILYMAGSSTVLNLKKMLGHSLARRAIGGETKANVVGQIGELLIAEAPAVGTPLVGKTLKESRLREVIGVNVVGIWERGRFEIPHPTSTIQNTTVLLLAGTKEQLMKYEEIFCIYHITDAPILILGGGKVGRAIAESLAGRKMEFRIVEKLPERTILKEQTIVGNAADLHILEKAGIKNTPSVIITTNDDATNIYLTIYCRRLRSDVQIISRANLDRNVSTLHRAGADLVMSYASLGANAIFNLLKKEKILMLAEGLDVFRLPIPHSLVGKTIAESRIREKTRCNIIAVNHNESLLVNPEPKIRFEEGNEIILLGTVEGERIFIKEYLE